MDYSHPLWHQRCRPGPGQRHLDHRPNPRRPGAHHPRARGDARDTQADGHTDTANRYPNQPHAYTDRHGQADRHSRANQHTQADRRTHIAAGVVDGLGLGPNARAALLTRGLAEMMRLGTALGARPRTLAGLAGMGDLILTCTTDLSRNRRLGQAIANGTRLEEHLASSRSVAEGVNACRSTLLLAGCTGSRCRSARASTEFFSGGRIHGRSCLS